MNKKILIILCVALSLLLIGVAYLFFQLKKAEKENEQILEQFAYEKTQMDDDKISLERDYVNLSNDLEGFSLKIDNDTILKKLNDEQKRVKLLLEELRTTKASNTKRINELKNELSSVRKVLTYYISRVDSLNKENTVLKTENEEVTNKFREATKKVDTLSEKNQYLNEKVIRAAQLEARNIEVEQQSKRGKSVSKLSKTDILRFSFVISKNITARVGEKTIYIRITNPNRDVLFAKSTDTFLFENKNIVFSARKNFEFSGQEVSQIIYWMVNETLIKGNYRVDIFVDSHLIGSKEFVLN